MAPAAAAAEVPQTPLAQLQAHMSQFAGGGMKIARLQYIVQHSAGELQRQAALAAVEELKRTGRVEEYRSLVEAHARHVGEGLDREWIATAEERSGQNLAVLERDFGMAKTQMKGADTREALKALGDHYRQRGKLLNAVKYYMRMRDYSTTPESQLEMCLLCIETSIESGSWPAVNQQCARALQVAAPTDFVAVGSVRIAQALSWLDSKKYRAVAMKLLDVPVQLGNSFSQVLPAAGVGTYATLCALASFSREELKAHFVDVTPFRAYLDLAPALQEVVHAFYHSDYSFLERLRGMEPTLKLDLFLGPHVSRLIEAVWERALKQYTQPYLTVDLRRMAAAFGTDTEQIEDALLPLISSGEMQARIDTEHKVLHAKRGNQRLATLEQALEAGEQLVLDTEAQLRKVNMQQQRFVYDPKKGQAAALGTR